ncbi:MAG TPA: DUF1289 domain-containing protein [Steroidobacteraceae bacterium]|jgi:predicted Fe-S protein YdhL (DUF1289 family)|nr:DUF1289 domain-containing protein [Steroidobacteraceae bacterium]
MVDAALSGAAGVPSPCINVCRLDSQGICIGCRRTIDEIAEWSRASEARRREILREVELRTMGAMAGYQGLEPID